MGLIPTPAFAALGENNPFESFIKTQTALITSGTSLECSWELTTAGDLTVRPTNGVSGRLGGADWVTYKDYIKTVTVASGITTANYIMFTGYKNLTKIDLAPVSYTSPFLADSMFYGCSSLKNIDLTNVDLSAATQLNTFFAGCTSLESINFGNVDTSKVTSFNSMFKDCKSLKSIDLTQLSTTKLKTAYGIFEGCSSLTTINMSNIPETALGNVETLYSTARYKSDLPNGLWMNKATRELVFQTPVSGLNIKKVLPGNYQKVEPLKTPDDIAVGSMGTCFWTLGKNGKLTISPAVGDSGSTFFSSLNYDDWNWGTYNDSIKSVYVSPGVSLVDIPDVYLEKYKLGSAFDGLKNVESIDISNLRTDNAKSLDRTFYGCTSLRLLNLGNINLSAVPNKDTMAFSGCYKLSEVSIPSTWPSRIKLPQYSFKTKWKSNSTGGLFTPDQISENRAGIQDVYTCFSGSPMYRLYNKWSGEHFFTSDANEQSHLVSVGWNDEGTEWNAPETGDPVYRLYNRWTGDHHFTTDVSERDACVNVGWTDEGIGFYSPTSGTPVYRLYNPYVNSFYHHYTTSKDEYLACIKAGWRDEAIGWYGV